MTFNKSNTKDKEILTGVGFQPTKKLYTKAKDVMYVESSFVRFDKDGVVMDFKPAGGITFTQDTPPKSLGKIRKLPNKQQWKVYYT